MSKKPQVTEEPRIPTPSIKPERKVPGFTPPKSPEIPQRTGPEITPGVQPTEVTPTKSPDATPPGVPPGIQPHNDPHSLEVEMPKPGTAKAVPVFEVRSGRNGLDFGADPDKIRQGSPDGDPGATCVANASSRASLPAEMISGEGRVEWIAVKRPVVSGGVA